MHTIGIMRTTLHGEEGKKDLEKQTAELRAACERQGLVLDGSYHQGPFDTSIWPCPALELAFDEEMDIVVRDLKVVATHMLAAINLPDELARHGKNLYSIADKRLFKPQDEDFAERLRDAFEELAIGPRASFA